jgi:quercetin dioxygenase-like cupin family protein
MAIVDRQTGNGVLSWGDLEVREYTSNGATKQVVFGGVEGARNFELRHFTIPPSGSGGFDEHDHDRGVVGTHGQARLVSGGKEFVVSQGASICIPRNERHQFHNVRNVPFAFLCVIPPKPLTTDG